MRHYQRRTGAALVLLLALLMGAMGSVLAQGPAVPVINEFVFNHTGSDNTEFVEIFGDPNTDYSAYTVLELEGDSSSAGVIDGVFPAGTTNGAGAWTTGFLNNVIENGTVTLLLVEGFSGSAGSDLDTNNDGTLDSTPWTALVDSVAVTDGGSSDRAYSTTVLAGGFDGVSFTPGGASRIPNAADTDTTSDWVRNDFDLAGIPGITGSPVVGEALNTPGAVNQLVGPPALSDPVINEFVSNTTGSDIYEFVEVFGDPNSDYSAFVVLQLEGEGSSVGTIDSVIPVGTTDANGLWVSTFFSNEIENGTFSLLLVENFTGVDGDDLDLNDDGTLEVTPWDRIVDSIGIRDWPTEVSYAVPFLESNYDGNSFEPGGASRIPDGVDTNTQADWVRNDFDGAGLPGYVGSPEFGEAINTPGLPNEAVPEPPALVCGDAATPISTIQGSGLSSPLVGTTVIVEAVVVADFQNSNELRGFFLQEQDADADADPATSDGVFVYEGTPTLDVAVGDVVRLQAGVVEFRSLTELSGVTDIVVCSSGNTLPAPAIVTLPVSALTDWEAYEGMLVQLPQTLTVTETFTLGRFGEVDLALGGRLYNPTNVVEPGSAAQALQDLNDRSRIQIDDGSSRQNPVPLPPYFADDGTLRIGDTTSSVVGVLHYYENFSGSTKHYEIHPVAPVNFTRVNVRPTTPAPVGGDLTVASFNVLNYFNTIDAGPDICGPLADQDCRGADTPDEFIRQETKIVSALSGLDADIVGLIEIENDGYEADGSIVSLVNALNSMVGAGTYAVLDPGVPYIGSDAIAVGLIYKPSAVAPVGAAAILDASVDPSFIDTKNRPVLIQTFEELATGARFTVAVNHLKSKGSNCNTLGDLDLGDGQGNCNQTRLSAAIALVNFLATDPTGSNDPDFLIIGDLNAYAKEDPIDAILAAGYTDLLQKFAGPQAYSYVFRGQAGYLDHALAVDSLVPQISGATAWHINADEPAALDYNNFNQDVLYSSGAFRASDHDPLLVGLALDIKVPLDVKPGNDVDPVNFGSNGKLPVAIYSTAQVDVTQIAPETIFLAGAPIAQNGKGYMVQYRDVNGDGLTDLFAHFESSLLEYPTDTDMLTFEAVYNGRRVYGMDDITIVPVPGMVCAFSADTWELVFGAEGPQADYMHGRTVAQVMEVGGHGHRWYQLAQATITTRLLEAEGVTLPDGLSVTLVEAESRLSLNSPDGRMDRQTRRVFENLTDVLDAFNTEAGCGLH